MYKYTYIYRPKKLGIRESKLATAGCRPDRWGGRRVAKGRWSCCAVENDRILMSAIKEFLL